MSQNFSQNFAQLVRRRRKALGWSTHLLARKADLPESAVSGIEEGRYRPSRVIVKHLCKALGLPLIAGNESAGFGRDEDPGSLYPPTE